MTPSPAAAAEPATGPVIADSDTGADTGADPRIDPTSTAAATGAISLPTTPEGEAFYAAPLDDYAATPGRIGLPSLGRQATERLAKVGIVKASQLFGQYLAFQRSAKTLFEYLDGLGVQYECAPGETTPELAKERLVAILQAKWLKVCEY